MRKAGTLAIVYVHTLFEPPSLENKPSLNYILSATTYDECNVFSEFNIFSGVLVAVRSRLGCIMIIKSVFGSLALFFSWRYGIVPLSDLEKNGGIKVVWE